MANIALVATGKVRVVESNRQFTGVAGGAITAGMAVRLDTTTGRYVAAAAGSAANARVVGIAARNASEGEALTVINIGVIDGFDLDDLDYGEAVFLSNTAGSLAEGTAGTVEVHVGTVIPAHSQTLGNDPDKLLSVAIVGQAPVHSHA